MNPQPFTPKINVLPIKLLPEAEMGIEPTPIVLQTTTLPIMLLSQRVAIKEFREGIEPSSYD